MLVDFVNLEAGDMVLVMNAKNGTGSMYVKFLMLFGVSSVDHIGAKG